MQSAEGIERVADWQVCMVGLIMFPYCRGKTGRLCSRVQFRVDTYSLRTSGALPSAFPRCLKISACV